MTWQRENVVPQGNHGTTQTAPQLQLLIDVARSVNASLDLQSIYDIALVQLRRLVSVDGIGIFIAEPPGTQFQLVACWSNPAFPAHGPAVGAVYPADQLLVGLAARTGRTWIEKLSADSAWLLDQQAWRNGFRSILATPVRHGGEILGGLALLSREPDAYDASQQTLCEAFAAQFAVSIANARMYAELRRSLDETRAAQEQLVHSERMRAVGELTSGVAHDFNNLLAAILGRIDAILTHPGLPHDVRQDLDVVLQIALDGAETVRRLQDLGRPRPNRPLIPVDLTQIGRDSLEITRSRWRDEPQRRGIRINVHDQLGEIPPIDGHPAELREVLTNLILNAVDAMPEGGHLTLRSGLRNGQVCLEVTDTGCGMSDEIRSHIFEPFFTTKGPAGTGIGLAVVYSIVERHRGTIEVVSAPGAGTTFQVCFPASRARLATTPHPTSCPQRRVGRILVVDDNEIIAQNLGRLLQSHGHDVTTALDGADALERFAKRRFDLVLTDLGMPNLNGFELADLIHQHRPETPVILVTGWGAQIDPQQAERHGIRAVIAKPFRGEAVEEVIQGLLASPSEPHRPPSSGPPVPSLPLPRRVLVVDDDPRLGSLVRRMVEGENLALEWVTAPDAAFAALEHGGFEVVLTDLRLANADGWEIVATLGERWPKLAVGLVTGSAEALDPDLAWRRGVDTIVAKPFRRADLLAAIDRALASRHARG